MQLKLTYGHKTSHFEFPDGAQVDVEALLAAMQKAQPAEYARWCDEQGHLRQSLSVFVNGENIRYRNGLQTLLNDGDEVIVIPLVAGG